MGWIANDVLDAGGEAHLWTAELHSVKQERELVARLNREVSDAYREFAAAADHAMGSGETARVRVNATGSSASCVTSCGETTSERPAATVPSARCRNSHGPRQTV